MPATSQGAILTALRAKLASVATARKPAATLKEHKTTDPFEASALAGRESFHARGVPDGFQYGEAFGLSGLVQCDWVVEVLLGHPPFGSDREREQFVSADVEKVASVVEFGTWMPAGVDAVFFEGALTDRSNPDGWISTLRFRVVYNGGIST